MKLNKLFVSLSAIALIAPATIAQTANAAEGNSTGNALKTEDGLRGEADGSVDKSTDADQFTTDVDGKQTGISHAGAGFTGGDLNLVRVPNFDFGIHKIKTGINDFNLNKPATNQDRSIIVSDARGTAAGWNVTAQLKDGKVYNIDDEGNVSAAADNSGFPSSFALTLNEAEGPDYGTYSNGTFTERNGEDVTDGVGKPESLQNAGTAASIGDGATTVWGAKEETGSGDWALNFQKDTDATLTIQSGQQKANTIYVAEIDWTLASTPLV